MNEFAPKENKIVVIFSCTNAVFQDWNRVGETMPNTRQKELFQLKATARMEHIVHRTIKYFYCCVDLTSASPQAKEQ
jgi:hypothetical protein